MTEVTESTRIGENMKQGTKHDIGREYATGDTTKSLGEMYHRGHNTTFGGNIPQGTQHNIWGKYTTGDRTQDLREMY